MDSTEYRRGILRVAGHAGFVQGMIEQYLPPEHKIIASRDIEGDALYRGYLVEGPDMPVVETGNYAPEVTLLFGIDNDGRAFCYWQHLAHKRWPANPDANPTFSD